MFRFGTSLFVSILCFAGTSAMAQGTGQPTDPQIAHIAYTAGQIDIKAAEQALGKSQNKNVKAFAEEMVKDHEAVNKKALALLDKLSVKPEDNGTSKALADAASKKAEELSKLSGAAFDKAYAENEVGPTINRQWGPRKDADPLCPEQRAQEPCCPKLEMSKLFKEPEAGHEIHVEAPVCARLK